MRLVLLLPPKTHRQKTQEQATRHLELRPGHCCRDRQDAKDVKTLDLWQRFFNSLLSSILLRCSRVLCTLRDTAITTTHPLLNSLVCKNCLETGLVWKQCPSAFLACHASAELAAARADEPRMVGTLPPVGGNLCDVLQRYPTPSCTLLPALLVVASWAAETGMCGCVCGVGWCAGFSRFNDYFAGKGVVAHAKVFAKKVGPLEFNFLSLDLHRLARSGRQFKF